MSEHTKHVGQDGDLRERVIGAIRTVKDPELPVNLYDLGLIYELAIDHGGGVRVRMTLTTPNCPVAEQMPGMVENAVKGVDGVGEVDVALVWEPKWEPSMMSEAAQLEVELSGVNIPYTGLTIGRRPSGG